MNATLIWLVYLFLSNRSEINIMNPVEELNGWEYIDQKDKVFLKCPSPLLLIVVWCLDFYAEGGLLATWVRVVIIF